MGIFPGFRAVLAGNDSVAERELAGCRGAMSLHGVMGNGRGEKSGRDGVVIEDSNRKDRITEICEMVIQGGGNMYYI